MILTLIIFFLVLSVLIFVHELGHFLAAKKFGVRVEEFGFGYPPRLFGKKIGETIYSLNWLPFGGFVRLYGEEIDRQKKDKEAFWQKSKGARSIVIIAGVTFNFLLAIILFTVVYSFSGIPTSTDKVRVLGVLPDSPAIHSGLKADDVILEINSQPLKNSQDFIEFVEKEKGEEITLTVERESERLILGVIPRENPPEGEGPLGVMISNLEMKKYPWWQMPFLSAWQGIKEALLWLSLIVVSLGKIITDLLGRGIVPQDVAGPVGIFQITGLVAQTGLLNIMQFIGILSINLAVINILPLPALDGGRLVFIAYEVVTRKKPRQEVEKWVNAAGMAFLLFLIILVTFNDLKRLVVWESLGSWWQKIWPF